VQRVNNFLKKINSVNFLVTIIDVKKRYEIVEDFTFEFILRYYKEFDIKTVFLIPPSLNIYDIRDSVNRGHGIWHGCG